MATLNLVRGVFQKEFSNSGAATGTNTYKLDVLSSRILVKTEFTAAAVDAATATLAVRRNHGDGSQTAEEATSTNNDSLTDGVTEATNTHGTLVAVDRNGAGSVIIDIEAISSGSADIWVGCD